MTTAGLLYFAHPASHPFASFAAAAVGVLIMGLFHAGHGAFGQMPEKDD